MNSIPRFDVVVVGVDGSDASTAAVDWAAAEADQRGSSLVVVTVVEMPRNTGSYLEVVADVPPSVMDEAQRLATTARARAATVLPADRVSTVVSDGSAAGHLIKASESAALVVVGNKHRSALGSLFAGSVSFPVAAHAHCPVVLIPEAIGDRSVKGAEGMRGVVVGVDGSHAGSQALEIAGEMAARAGEPLTIISAWDIPVTGAWTTSGWADGGGDPTWREALHDDATAAGEQAASSIRDLHPQLVVSNQVVEAPAAHALVEAGQGATLVVLGSRGRGGFASLVLGSVSHAVIHDCAGPVMIVR
jgi:nucleotide-binding universal stress UspA family protein